MAAMAGSSSTGGPGWSSAAAASPRPEATHDAHIADPSGTTSGAHTADRSSTTMGGGPAVGTSPSRQHTKPSPARQHSEPSPRRQHAEPSSQQQVRRAAPVALRLQRYTGERLVAGVAAAIARRLVVDPVFVRAAFTVLAFAGGAGVLAYLVLWAVTDEIEGAPAPAAGGTGSATGQDVQPNLQRAAALGLQVLGLLLLLRSVGAWLGDGVVWPVTLAAFGSMLVYARSDEHERARWTRGAGRLPSAAGSLAARIPVLRVALGALLVAIGMTTLLLANEAIAGASRVFSAVGIAVTGVALVLGPGIVRLARQLADERRERIRSQERSELAAHLHDSVLHTLALIQRSDEPAKMAGLARAQERELRTWLYGRGDTSPGASLSVAVGEVAGRVERLHRVAVEAVVVGDAQLDEPVRALLDACREAVVNAARHSGATTVSLYVEVEPDAVTAYVRDEGKGFDPAAVPEDRRGIAESIRGRMKRHGGTATILTSPGEGTEVVLELPRRAS